MVRITYQKLVAKLAGENFGPEHSPSCPLFPFFHPQVAKSTQKYFSSSLSFDLN
jgi:hypothetical protein